jgi:predicted GNAT family N-acyltransferase
MSSPTDPPGFAVRQASWARDRAALSLVRTLVFVDEQGVPEPLEWDGADPDALHLLAEDALGRPIGTARLLPSGQIGRLAVLRQWRGLGVGSALLGAALERAAAPGRPPPFLHAQTAALGFYGRHGFAPRGEVFEEAGIPHRAMVYEAGQ